MKSVQLVVALGLFVAGTIASVQQAMSLATCSSCATTYQDCVTSDPNNWQSCYNSYTSCASGCSWTNTAAKSLASCTTCATDYQGCVARDYTNWQSCLNTYNTCIPGCTFGAKTVSLASCLSCSTNYNQCVTANPYNW